MTSLTCTDMQYNTVRLRICVKVYIGTDTLSLISKLRQLSKKNTASTKNQEMMSRYYKNDVHVILKL